MSEWHIDLAVYYTLVKEIRPVKCYWESPAYDLFHDAFTDIPDRWSLSTGQIVLNWVLGLNKMVVICIRQVVSLHRKPMYVKDRKIFLPGGH